MMPLRKAKSIEMPFIKTKALEWDLDTSYVDPNQFLVAVDEKNKIVGFGRIKKGATCFELGTVGVLPEYRRKGIGEAIIRKLIDKFPSKNIWIATDQPEYFKRFGFRSVKNGPKELNEKISQMHCCQARTGVKIMLLTKEKDG